MAARQAAKRVGHGNMKVIDNVEEWANLVEVASAAAGLQPVTAEVLLELCNLEKRVFSNDNAAAWLTKLRQSSFADPLVQGMFLPPRYPMINANAMVRYLTKLTNRWKVLPVRVWALWMSGCMHACMPPLLLAGLILPAGRRADILLHAPADRRHRTITDNRSALHASHCRGWRHISAGAGNLAETCAEWSARCRLV